MSSRTPKEKSLLDDALDFGPEEVQGPQMKPSDLSRLKAILDKIQEISDRIDRLADQM